MARITHDRLESGLKQGRLGGVFFLHGEEGWLRTEAESLVTQAHLDPSTRDFNFDLLRGPGLDAEAFASVLQTPPMMAEWRVVLVRDAQALAASARLRGIVEELLASPPPGLALILSAELPPKSKAKFWDRLTKDATAVEYPALDAADLPGWLAEWAVSRGFEVEPEAARLLVSAVGTDLGVLLQELTKLSDGVGEGGTVDRGAVERGVGAIRRQDRWAWFDMVGSGDLAAARAALPVLLDAGESGVGLVIGLGAQFLRLALGASGGERALSAELPRHQQWLARRLLGQARRWSPETLDGVLDDLLRADRLLKSASLDDRQVMDELLLRMQARRQEVAA